MSKNIDQLNVNIAVNLYLKPEYKIDAFVSGNKFRKLKYNIKEAEKYGVSTILTFGGAYSNHISAVAKAGKAKGFKTIGVIRGEELFNKINDNIHLSVTNTSKNVVTTIDQIINDAKNM